MIKIEGVSKTYRTKTSEVKALKDINLEIAKGEIFGVIGQSGSGKSTLIRCINQLEKVDSGRVLVGDSDMTKLSESELRKKRRKISMIFQHFNLLKNFTVYQNVAMPLSYSGKGRKEVEKNVRNLLELVGLSDKLKSYPSQLSGGQKQRVAIARALANEPNILLSDEATSALDPETTHSILALLQELNRKLNLTVVIITHQMSVVKDICDRVAVFSAGEVVEQGPTLEVFTNPAHPVTRQFSDSLFQLDRIQDILSSAQIRDIVASGGIIARLLFKGQSADKPLLSQISREFGIDANVIFGNIVLFGNAPVGNLYVALSGGRANVEQAILYIKEHGILFERLSGAEQSNGKEVSGDGIY